MDVAVGTETVGAGVKVSVSVSNAVSVSTEAVSEISTGVSALLQAVRLVIANSNRMLKTRFITLSFLHNREGLL